MAKKKYVPKNNYLLKSKEPEQLALVPAYILFPLWVVSLVLPNLIYSGVEFADTLHILKWTVTGVPVAIAVIIAGLRLIFFGRERFNLKLDKFSIVWAFMMAYAAVQPLWVKLFSPTGFVLEMTCVLAVWAFYVISVMSFPEWGLRPILFLASINAAINTIFAELQIRGMNNFAFLDGTAFEWLKQYSSIILPTPGNYIGNTAQQNMFGLWLAVCTLGMVYLFMFDLWSDDGQDKNEHGKKIWLPVLNTCLIIISIASALTTPPENTLHMIYIGMAGFFILAQIAIGVYKKIFPVMLNVTLMAANFWGLISSTSRSGVLALVTGLLVLIIFASVKFGRYYALRFLGTIFILGAVFWASTFSLRSEQIVGKTIDIVQNAENIGNRRGIWATTYAMFQEHPQGVGTGQYKWHYLEAQREGFRIFPDAPWYEWQYTHWAHNEFFQWFCEGGWFGGIILLLMYLIWFWPALKSLFKKSDSVQIQAVWGAALVSLISFAAFFTRPFHRIENMVWIALAFALSNNGFGVKAYDYFKSKILTKLTGVICIAASVWGIYYISGGIYGNYILRRALSTQNEKLQLYYLNEADKYPIVYEDTERNLAFHYMQVADLRHDDELAIKGLNILWAQFQREPRSEDLQKLVSMAQKYQNVEALEYIVSLFQPGAYHIAIEKRIDYKGNVIDAHIMRNGSAVPEYGSEDDEENEEQEEDATAHANEPIPEIDDGDDE